MTSSARVGMEFFGSQTQDISNFSNEKAHKELEKSRIQKPHDKRPSMCNILKGAKNENVPFMPLMNYLVKNKGSNFFF